MPKTTAQEYIDRGYTREMFRKSTEQDFAAFLSGVIDEQSGLLEGRIGSAVYGSVEAVKAAAVTRVERLLVLAELLSIRIDVVLGNVDAADGDDMLKLRRNRGEYLAESETLVNRLAQGLPTAGSDYAGAVLESEHPGALVLP